MNQLHAGSHFSNNGFLPNRFRPVRVGLPTLACVRHTVRTNSSNTKHSFLQEGVKEPFKEGVRACKKNNLLWLRLGRGGLSGTRARLRPHDPILDQVLCTHKDVAAAMPMFKSQMQLRC
jgi:hypothetical protein